MAKHKGTTGTSGYNYNSGPNNGNGHFKSDDGDFNDDFYNYFEVEKSSTTSLTLKFFDTEHCGGDSWTTPSSQMDGNEYKIQKVNGDVSCIYWSASTPTQKPTPFPTTSPPTVNCGPGEQPDAQNVCVPCPAGTYKEDEGIQPCTACPQFELLQGGSVTGRTNCTVAISSGFWTLVQTGTVFGDSSTEYTLSRGIQQTTSYTASEELAVQSEQSFTESSSHEFSVSVGATISAEVGFGPVTAGVAISREFGYANMHGTSATVSSSTSQSNSQSSTSTLTSDEVTTCAQVCASPDSETHTAYVYQWVQAFYDNDNNDALFSTHTCNTRCVFDINIQPICPPTNCQDVSCRICTPGTFADPAIDEFMSSGRAVTPTVFPTPSPTMSPVQFVPNPVSFPKKTMTANSVSSIGKVAVVGGYYFSKSNGDPIRTRVFDQQEETFSSVDQGTSILVDDVGIEEVNDVPGVSHFIVTGSTSSNGKGSISLVSALVRDGQTPLLKNEKLDWRSGSANVANMDYGIAVDIKQGTILVGAPKDENSGGVYVVKAVFNGPGSNWSLSTQSVLHPLNPGSNDRFGRSVVLSEDGLLAVVGAPGRWSNRGTMHVFERNSVSDYFTESNQYRRYAPDKHQSQFFGQKVATDGSVIVVGAFKDNEKGQDAGAAYLFQRNPDTNSSEKWVMLAKYSPSSDEGSPTTGQHFGYDVSIGCDVIAIGAPGFNNNVGAVFLYKKNVIIPGHWTLIRKIQPSDMAGVEYTGMEFGRSVSVGCDDFNREVVTVGSYDGTKGLVLSYAFSST